jgi:hypothetical protein
MTPPIKIDQGKFKLVLWLFGGAVLVVLVASIFVPRDNSPSLPSTATTAGGTVSYSSAPYSQSDLHAERTRLYHESQKAAEDWNGRPLTSFEKEELWQFTRDQATLNLEEQSHDPSKEPDH